VTTGIARITDVAHAVRLVVVFLTVARIAAVAHTVIGKVGARRSRGDVHRTQ
jgi:hypothetical protein